MDGQDQSVPGGIVINHASALGKELLKWEQHQSHFVGRGQTPGNAYVFRPYPKMVYRAVKKQNGKVVCMEGEPSIHQYSNMNEYNMALNAAAQLEAQCHKDVHSEEEWLMAKGQGWCETPPAAIAQFEKEEQERAAASAEAIYAAKRMGEKAREEFAAAEAATAEHVVDVTPASKKRQTVGA